MGLVVRSTFVSLLSFSCLFLVTSVFLACKNLSGMTQCLCSCCEKVSRGGSAYPTASAVRG